MLIQKFAIIVCCVLLSCSASLATTNFPDPCESTATMYGGTYQTISLYSLPNGMGLPFNEAQINNDGTTIDATITLLLLDSYGVPIAHYPAEDMWLESYDDGMAPCGGTMADENTNPSGETFWSDPLRAGGYSMTSCAVYISGMALCQAPFNMYFNSADVNGDGVVNLLDLNLVATAFFNDFNYSIDFYPDGVLNLSDIGRFSSAIGASCN